MKTNHFKCKKTARAAVAIVQWKQKKKNANECENRDRINWMKIIDELNWTSLSMCYKFIHLAEKRERENGRMN